MSPLQQYSVRVFRRWPVIVALALVGAIVSAAWFFATATTTYTATAALSTQSAERGPEQDAVLALGYVDYFNQDSYQDLLRRDASVPADVELSAMTAATSPILYISATGPDEQDVRTAATVATETFRNHVRDSLVEERRRAADDIQAEIDRNTAELTGPAVLQDVHVNIVLDQIRSLQGRLTDTLADNTNHLKPLQAQPGVSSETPSPVIAVATGAVGGAVLGVLLALLLAVTDPRVRNRVDVPARLGLDVLADLAGVTPAERARLVRNLAGAARRARAGERTIIAVVAPRGGAAAHRVARELAVAGASRRTGAVLVHADGTTSGAGGPGFFDALSGSAGVRPVPAEGVEGLQVLQAGATDRWTSVSAEQVTEVVDELAAGSALVVLDVSPLVEIPDSQVVCAAADQVLLVLERGGTRWSDARAAVALLTEVQAPLAGIVLDEPAEAGTAIDGGYYSGYDDGGDDRAGPTPEPVQPSGSAAPPVPAPGGNGSTLPVPPPSPRPRGLPTPPDGTDAGAASESRPAPTPRPRPVVPVGAPSDDHQQPRAGSPGHD